MSSLLALLAVPLFVRCFGRVGLRAAVVVAALALSGLTGCAEIVGFGDHAIEPACGDGGIGVGEGWEDANGAAGVGWSACSVDEGFTCVGELSVCGAVCGDGARAGLAEECDDGNTAVGDGCNAACEVEAGFVCEGSPSECS